MPIFPAHRSHYTVYNDTGVGRVAAVTAPDRPYSLEVPVPVVVTDAAPIIIYPTILNGLQSIGQRIQFWCRGQGGGTSVLRSAGLLRAHGTVPTAINGYRAVAEFDFAANALRLRVQKLVANVATTIVDLGVQGIATDIVGLRFVAADVGGSTSLQLYRRVGIDWQKIIETTDSSFVGVVGQWALGVTAPVAVTGNKILFGGLEIDRAVADIGLPATDTFDSWI